MRILVTGGAGFIGSWVSEMLAEEGHYVVVIDDLSNGLESNVPKKARFYKMNILSPDVEKIFAEEKFDIVDHHAAKIDLFWSKAFPETDIEANLLGTINLLKCSVKYGVKKFIFASSGGAIYNPELGLPSKEDMEFLPPSPYGINKLAAEKYLLYFNREYGLNYLILRYSNIYGPRQGLSKESGVVSIFTRAMLKKEPVYIYGDGKQTRDFVYIDDVVYANKLAIEDDKVGIFNISSGKGTSINDLFYILGDIVGYENEPIYLPERPGEVKHSVLDNSKARKALSFEPKVNLYEGLKRTVDYFRIWLK